MRASVSSTREPMKPESRPSSEQGLASAVNLSGQGPCKEFLSSFSFDYILVLTFWVFLTRQSS